MRLVGSLLISAGCAALLALVAKTAPTTQSVSGVVQSADDKAVPKTEVSIDGAGTTLTTDSGKFTFPLAPPLKVGFPATFRVVGWVVIDPCVLARGRIYLPDPEAETIAVKVLRPGDRRLLSGKSIGCLLEEEAARFESGPLPTEAEHRAARLRLQTIASYRTASFVITSLFPEPHGSTTFSGVDEFAVRKAEELGFSAEQLNQAIATWAQSVSDLYDKGLAALYERRYADAAWLISESLGSSANAIPERYVALARAEYEQGHYSAAEAGLRKVLGVHRDDPLILQNLKVVFDAAARGSTAPAEDACSRGWKAFANRDFLVAVRWADECLDQFRSPADQQQASLQASKEPAPPTGVVSPQEKAKILDREPLNSVATACWIKGRSAEYLYSQADRRKKEEFRKLAIQGYQEACRYSYGRTWDPQGLFWSPCEASSHRLEGFRN